MSHFKLFFCGCLALCGGLSLGSVAAFAQTAKVDGQTAAETAGQPKGATTHVQQLAKKVHMFEARLRQLEQSVGALESIVGTGEQGVGKFSSNTTAGLEQRIKRLESALRKEGAGVPSGSAVHAAPTQLAPSITANQQGYSTGSSNERAPTPSSRQPIDTTGLAPLPEETSTALKTTTSALGASSVGRKLYDEAYNALLGRDYQGASQKFSQFLRDNPNDSQVSNAQYWLGETYFMRGKYKEAANQFLKGYKLYRNGSKASDSLLKLAMSLQRLGKNQAACSTYGELQGRFKELPSYMNRRIAAERKRAGCS